MAVRGHLNHHAVTVGDGAHGELATRTRVEPLDVRTAASCDDDFGAGQPCREDLAFAVSQLKALVEGGLGEAEAAASGCVVCELLHAWSVAAVRTRQLIGQRSDAEERLRLNDGGFEGSEENERVLEEDEMDEADEVERAFDKVRARRGGAKGREAAAAAAAAKPPRRPRRVRDFVF